MTAKEKRAVRQKTLTAVLRGKLNRPDTCEKCGAGGDIFAHHADYSQPLVVEWLCRTCHRDRHKGEQKGRGVGRPARRPPPAAEVERLAAAELHYQQSAQTADEAREERNRLVLLYLDTGWTHAQVAETTGMSRGRVSQIRADAKFFADRH